MLDYNFESIRNSIKNMFLVANSEVSCITNNTIISASDATYFEDVLQFNTRTSSKLTISKNVNLNNTPSSSL